MVTSATMRVVLASLVAVAVAVSLASCGGRPTPTPSSSGSPSASAEPTPSSTPTAIPTFRPDGSALQNLDYFTWVLQRAVDRGKKSGSAFVDALVDAGFKKKDMEATPGRTAIDLEADNIQVAVKFNGNCLVGQYGNIGLTTAALPVLSTGLCLVGTDRQV